jgi:hypothetical protein
VKRCQLCPHTISLKESGRPEKHLIYASKHKVENLHRAFIAEVYFTDTFETEDGTYRYGQAIVDYRSRFGVIIPLRSRKKVGWAIGEFCCRHFVPLILIRDR